MLAVGSGRSNFKSQKRLESFDIADERTSLKLVKPDRICGIQLGHRQGDPYTFASLREATESWDLVAPMQNVTGTARRIEIRTCFGSYPKPDLRLLFATCDTAESDFGRKTQEPDPLGHSGIAVAVDSVVWNHSAFHGGKHVHD